MNKAHTTIEENIITNQKVLPGLFILNANIGISQINVINRQVTVVLMV